MKNIYFNLTQMLLGCSKRNGMTVSASNPDGEPTVNRQSRLMSLSGKKAEKEQLSPSCLLSASFPPPFRSRYLRYAAMIFCVLAMSVGQVWGGNTPITWTPTSANVTTLIGSKNAHIDVGSGSNSFSVYAIRNGTAALAWSNSAFKFNDNALYKSGIAVYVPSTSNDIVSIEFYLKSTGTNNVAYKEFASLPVSSDDGASALSLTSSYTSYQPFATPAKGKYYAVGGKTTGSGGDRYLEKIVVTFADDGGGGDPGDECTKIFWFAKAADATTAGVENNTSTFTGVVSGTSSVSGTITIDGTNYSVTGRGNNGNASISFTVPANKTATLYGLANSSGSSARTLTLTGPDEYSQVQSTSASSSTAGAITFTDMTAGNYSIAWGGNGAISMLCLKLCDAVTPSCTAPNHVDVAGRWDRFAGETISLTATAYSSAGTGSPIAAGSITGYQWQKLVGSTWTDVSNGTESGAVTTGATTANLQITNCIASNSGKYRCVVSTGATCSTASATATDGSEGLGVKVYTLECYTDGTTVYNFTRVGDTQAGTCQIALAAGNHTFKFHADGTYYGNNGTIIKDETNWVCSTTQGNLTIAAGLGGTFTINMEYSTSGNSSVEGEPEISVTYPRKTIYFVPNNDWSSNSAKFAIYYFRKDGDEVKYEGWTDFLSAGDCGTSAEIPQWAGVNVIAVRLNSDATVPTWDKKWNQTSDILVEASKDLITITGWEKSQTYTAYSPTTYTVTTAVSPAGYGTVSAASVTGVACGTSISASTNTLTVGATNVTATPATTVQYTYAFNNWSWSPAGATVTDNVTATANFTRTARTYTVTLNKNGGTINADNVDSYTYGEGATLPTNVTKDGYRFMGWYDNEGLTGSAVTTIANDATGNKTYWAKWAQVYTITNGTPANGTITISKSSAIEGEAVSISVEANTGYTFDAWNIYKTSDAGTTVSPAAASASTSFTMPAYNVTVDATFNAKTTTITINANTSYHGSTTPGSVTATYGSALPSFTAAAGVSGYSLTGYFTEATSGTKVINADGTLVASTDYADASGNWKYESATLTLYAQYEEAEAGCIDANSTNFGEGNSSGDASKTLDDGTVVAMNKCTNSASSVSIGGNILFTAPTGKAFETFSFVATCGTNDRTNYYKINGGSQQDLESSTTTSKRYTITVPESPNTTTIQIIKSGTTPAVTEFCYTYKDVCTTPATAFANGAYTVGGSALDLSTLISGKQGSGAITYTVKNANGTGAAIAGTSFTATSAGTATVTATQAANGDYCEKVMDATITVSAGGGYPAGYIYITDVKATPETGATAAASSLNSYDTGLNGSFDKGDFTGAKYAITSSSSGTYTLTFSPALDVSSYSDRKLDVWWGTNGTGSNSGISVKVNGSEVYSDATNAGRRNKIQIGLDNAVTATSITTIQLKGASNSGTVFFRVGVKGTPATPCTVEPTVSATTKGTTTSSTQVVNCEGISSLGTGTCTITSYGFVYGTSANPTLSDSHVEVGTSYTVTGTAFAETTLTGLTPSTPYYVRAYATNGAGTGYGEAVSFTTSAAPVGAPVITDQPDLSEVALGETASFSLTATGATSYQWYSCDSEGENRVEASGESATTDNYSYTTTATGTTYYICKVSNASGDTWSEVVGSIVNPVSFTIHYEAGSTDKTSYTTETFTQNKVVNAEVADYIGSLTKFAFNGVEISDKGKKGTMSMQISMPTSEDAGKYVSFTFTVAPNYYLSVDNINIQCQPVGNDNHNYKVVLTDALGTTITGTSSTNTKGELNSINFPAAQLSGKRLVGLVTVKIFGWYSSSDTYRLAKDTYITGTVSSLPAPTASWTARPASATVGDGGKTYTLTTDGTNTVAWSITDQSGATGAVLSSSNGMTTTLGSYTTAGSLYVQASVTGDGIHYLSTPATLLRQRVVISADCEETTLISATLSSCTGTGAVSGTPGGTSAVAFESCESLDGGYKMGKNGSYMRLELSSGNFAANDEVKITITKASDQGDGALHIYKYASETWTELGSVTAAGAGTYSYTLTETNVSTAFNTIGLYRTGSNQNPYVKALSVVRNSCSASKPSSVSVTASAPEPYAIDDALTLTVEATNADTYQWYSNTNNTASDGFLLVGETATTYSPSTAIAGTTYYYCVATNTSGSTVSNIITVTVNSAKTAPTVSWTDTDEEPNYGGGGYTVTATVSTGAWDGTLTTDMLTASDGVTLTGVSVEGKVITATYGVTETARSPLSFSLTLPETTNYTALAANKEITFTRCGEGAVIETTEHQLPVKSSYTYTTSTKPNYSWITDGVGWLTLVAGSSTLSSTSDSYSGFSYRSNSGKSSITFYSELDAVTAVRVYIKGGGTTTLSKVQKGTTLGKYTKLTPSTDYDYLYSNGSSSIESREQAYIEITFKTALSANTFVEITLNRNTEYYGVGLITGNSEVGNITTALTWATNPGITVNKKTTDANFRYEAVKASDEDSRATLGTISYKSSVPAVATVSATGVVDILSAGSTTITATLASSGCYKKATLSYNLVVAEATCTDEAGTITASGEGITIDGNTVTKTNACANVTLTVSGHTGDGGSATYQWYKDGVSMGESYRSKSISVTANGDYTVEVTNDGGEHCTMPATNTITITGNAISITKIVDEWYVKNGRRTPDIALATIEGTTSYTVNDGISDITTFAGCGFELRDGILYLRGQKENGDEPSGLTEGNATLTITAVSACGDDPTATITIHKQVETAKPSIAFIVDGTSGNPVNEVADAKTISRPLWVYLSTYFDLTGCNAYWTNNEKQIRQYYSQFDAIVITDDPSTDAKPKSGLKYVNALGTMVDVRPILTMEAYVGKYGASSNWHIGGTPSSPNPRQYELKLQCKDHDIFSDLTSSANFRSEEIGGETYYYVTMVDNSVTPYAGLADDAETETYPALQGFSAASIKGTGMLGIGTISDGTLQGGVERQDEQTARMMILGIQHQAMAALTSEGKQVIKNAINYLLKTDMEEVDDCSNYFIGTTDHVWSKASNWSSGKVPDASTKARILVPVTISTKVHVAQVDIAVGGRSKHYDSGNTDCSGSVTIASTGALIVDGQVRRTTNGRLYTEDELQPTTPADLTIRTSSSAQGALIFDNSDGETQATVELYSLGRKEEDGHYQFQYYAVPMDYVSVSESFAGSDIYTYVWHEATGWERRGYYTDLYAFEGVGITTKLADPKTYTMKGALASTATKEITLTKDADGYNLIGNSWTAPIQISQLEEDNGSLSNKTVYIYIAGNDTVGGGTEGTSPGQWTAIPFSAAGFGAWSGLKVIPAMQAFELVPTSEETLTLDYEKVVRGDNKSLTEPLHAPRRVADHAGIELMRIRVADSKTHTDLHLFEGERFSDEFDNGWEAAYKDGDDGTTKLYADVALGHMAVVATDELEGTLLGFAPGKETEYTFSFGGEGMGYYLNDLKLKTSTLISEGETYSFTYEEGDTNRFYISRTRIDAPQTPTGVENTHSGTVKAHKFIYNDKLYIMLNGRVYSAEGQIVK